MFTLFQEPDASGCCLDESVYKLIEQPQEVPAPGPPLYQSRYACQVREEALCAKVACYRTMGIPSVCLCSQKCFLKKNTRSPIFVPRPGKLPGLKVVSDKCKPCFNNCKKNQIIVDEEVTCPESCEKKEEPECEKEHPCCPTFKDDCKKTRVCVLGCKQKGTGRITRICTCLGHKSRPPVVPHDAKLQRFANTKQHVNDNIRKAIRLKPLKPVQRFVDDRVGTTHNWCTSGYPRLHVYNENFGKVPCYIGQIKEELYVKDQMAKYAMVEKERELENAIRPLDPLERQAMLCGLKAHWEQVFGDFQAMPLNLDNPGKIAKKSEMEKELKKIEKDIQTLERHDFLFVADACRSFYLA